jgi:hypothetical protein
LQTSTIDISGNGQLSVGKLPDGVDNSSLTWVPVRLYTPAEGGQNPPSFAPNEVRNIFKMTKHHNSEQFLSFRYILRKFQSLANPAIA